MSYTWNDLLKSIAGMDEEQRKNDVAVFDQEEDEYFSVEGIAFCDDGVLDDGNAYLVFPVNFLGGRE